MTDKEYFFQEMKMTDVQLERLWNWYNENVKTQNQDAIVSDRTFQIEYQFSSIGTAKIAKVKGAEFWIDEEESNP